jgi:hypothetical protein
VSETVFAIVYSDAEGDGAIKTLTINGQGTIGKSWLDTLKYDKGMSQCNSVTRVAADVFAIAYSGPDSDGWLVTVNVTPDGIIGNSVIDTLEFDTIFCQYPQIINVCGSVYAVSYLRGGVRVATFSIDDTGTIGNLTGNIQIAAGALRFPDIVSVSPNLIAIVWNSSGPGADGFIATVPVDSMGNISAVRDIRIYDEYCQDYSRIIHVAGSVYCICYEGASGDGYATTIDIIP